MSAVVINETEHHSHTVGKIVRWVLRELEVDKRSLVVKVKHNTSHMHSGRFWPNARNAWTQVWSRETGAGRVIRPNLPDGIDHLIVARIPHVTYGFANRVRRGGPPKFEPQTWEESLVCIVAHEGMHFHQFLNRQPGRPRWSEVECEWAEYRLLKRWRERRNP